MLLRICFAVKKAWQFRSQLGSFMRDPALQLENVQQLSLKILTDLGIKALVLDYDGVLAAHGEPQPRMDVLPWLLKMQHEFTAGKIYVLSNKPTPQRQAYFATYLPKIAFIKAMRKKPYPDGLEQIMQQSGVPAQEVLLVDDRLLTGILATLIADTRGLWITRPYINIMARPFTESGFIMLRWLDRMAVRIFGAG